MKTEAKKKPKAPNTNGQPYNLRRVPPYYPGIGLSRDARKKIIRTMTKHRLAPGVRTLEKRKILPGTQTRVRQERQADG